jgi:hypothetical protein
VKPPVSGVLNPFRGADFEIALSRQGHIEWITGMLHVPLPCSGFLVRPKRPITINKVLFESSGLGISQVVGNRIVVDLLDQTSPDRIVDTDIHNGSPFSLQGFFSQDCNAGARIGLRENRAFHERPVRVRLLDEHLWPDIYQMLLQGVTVDNTAPGNAENSALKVLHGKGPAIVEGFCGEKSS